MRNHFDQSRADLPCTGVTPPHHSPCRDHTKPPEATEVLLHSRSSLSPQSHWVFSLPGDAEPKENPGICRSRDPRDAGGYRGDVPASALGDLKLWLGFAAYCQLSVMVQLPESSLLCRMQTWAAVKGSSVITELLRWKKTSESNHQPSTATKPRP